MPSQTHLRHRIGYQIGGFDAVTALLLYTVRHDLRALVPPRPPACGYGWDLPHGRQHVIALPSN